MGISSRARGATAALVCALALAGCAGTGAADQESVRKAPEVDARPERAPEPGAVADPTETSERATVTITRPARGRVDAPYARAVRMLRAAPERGAGYDRNLFEHWIDTDGDGCDTRDEVLLAEAVRRPRVVGDCDLVGGRWRSSYDGVVTRDPSTFDVDHVVPLAEAWASGARRWSPARREAFANDQGDARSLAAVSASSNRSKSDGDPADWLPELGTCRYLRDWVAVKLRWDLAVQPRERSVLRSSGCRGRVAVRVVRAGAAPASDDGERTTSVPAAPSAPTRTRPPRRPTAGPTDPRFDTCGAANDAGYGDYVSGADAEYGWYDDRDGDGQVCET